MLNLENDGCTPECARHRPRRIACRPLPKDNLVISTVFNTWFVDLKSRNVASVGGDQFLRTSTKQEMLSPFARNLAGQSWIPAHKLIPNLYDKTNYVTHYRNLQFFA